MSPKRLFKVALFALFIIASLTLLLFKGEVIGEKDRGMGEMRVGTVDIKELKDSHPLSNQVRHLEERVANYKLTYNNEVNNLIKTQENIDKQLGSFNEQLEKRLQLLQDRAIEGIMTRREELEESLIEYHSRLEEDMLLRLIEFKDELTGEIEEEVEEISYQFNHLLEQYKAEVNRKYNSNIINLRMKLNRSSLAHGDREDVEAELEDTMAKRELKIINKQDYYDGKLEEIIREKEINFEGEVSSYREVLEVELKEKIIAKEKSLEEQISSYIKEEENRLKEEMDVEEEELRTGIERNLITAEARLVGRVEDKIDGLELEINRLEEQLLDMRNNKIDHIDNIIEEVAKGNGIYLVIDNYLENIDGVDITKDIIKAMK